MTIINTIPKLASLSRRPDSNNRVAYGRYLVNAGACIHCHSQDQHGQLVKGKEFGGGVAFPLPTGGTVYSANITPDVTGIGSWSEETFVNHFTQYGKTGYSPKSIAHGEFNSVMPYTSYAGLRKNDLKAMYAYLKTLPKVQNSVTGFIPPGH